MSVLVEYICPRCHRRNDAATTTTGKEDVRPRPGDIGICIGCGAPLEFRAAMPPRWLSLDEVMAFPPEARGRLMTAILAIVTHQPSTLDAP